MKTTPRPLIVLHPDRLLRDRLQRVSRKRFHMATVDEWMDLRDAVSEAPPAAVVLVDPYHGQDNGGGPSPHLYNVLKAFPSATVVAAMDTTPERYRDLWMLGEWGVAEILQVEEDVSSEALRRRLVTARAQHLRLLLTQDHGVPLTGRARSLIDAAVDTVMAGGHPKDLAKTLGFSASTLLRWCRRSQLPTPRRLLLWMRVLFASALLDDPGHTVFSVGMACGYSGDQALRRAIRSVIPYTPSELRARGAFDTVSKAFFAELAELRDDQADKR
jgi:AraC-like DNA-binding protein